MNIFYKLRVLIGDIMWWFLDASYIEYKSPDFPITGGGGVGFDTKPYQAGDTVEMKFNSDTTR